MGASLRSNCLANPSRTGQKRRSGKTGPGGWRWRDLSHLCATAVCPSGKARYPYRGARVRTKLPGGYQDRPRHDGSIDQRTDQCCRTKCPVCVTLRIESRKKASERKGSRFDCIEDRLTCVAAFTPYSFAVVLKINIDSLLADSMHQSDFPASITGFDLVKYIQ